VTEFRVNVNPGQTRRERIGRLVVTELEFDLVPMESAKESIEFETVEMRPAIKSSGLGDTSRSRRGQPIQRVEARTEASGSFLKRFFRFLRGSSS
jgi:hypothetical protein